MASRKEVADMAGVSEATVSRVLNNVGPIKEETRRKVLEAAERLGYHLNAIASSFAKGKSGNIGVVLPHVPKVRLFSTFYFSEILSGIGEAIHSSGMGLLLLYREPGADYDYLSLFRTSRIDACLVLGATSLPQDEQSIARMADAGVPFYVVDQRYDKSRIPSVLADHVQGSYLATKHLVDQGHRAIGFLNGSSFYSNSLDRLEGYRRALRECGIPYDGDLLFEGNYSRKSGFEATESILRNLDRLDAVACSNDRMAIGLIQGLKEAGIGVPERLPVIGYDDSDAAALIDPALSTIRVPFYEMGKLAAERLLGELSSGAEREEPDNGVGVRNRNEVLPTSIIIRKSSITEKES
ncbi:LacI family DNA-binding transcriptional regulator [Cohnella sp. AR92]|uniref:LacI family DNA-binding transcriptional regulator n=1 Tax=Cohnella sp. AR92 TaxID=648716 RepID=UPI000F8F0C15|nr:LacI family DNA-binding transcriptional regulator [Cohnella sp. AR92]RUS48711.1 LacI family transcriptional regulator [Cohnella sp. AR92]